METPATLEAASVSSSYTPLSGSHDEWYSSEETRALWQPLISQLNDWGSHGIEGIQQKKEDLLKEIGVSYAEFITGEIQSRHLKLDPIPHILREEDYQFIKEGIRQRASLLNEVLRDCYGEQTLVKSGKLPSSLLYEQRNYNRALVGHSELDQTYLNFYSIDATKNKDGEWVILKDYTHIPEGLGFALENRIATANLYSDLIKGNKLIRLVHFFQSYRDSLYAEAPSAVDTPLVVLLSSRVQDSSYFEDVFLCQYLGIPLVDGGELTVREDRVYLKTVSGLMRVHVIIRRINEEDADPLASPTPSYNGVPGLMEVVRKGNVKILNPPGTGILEVSDIYAFLPTLCKEMRGEELMIPSALESKTACFTSPKYQEGTLVPQPVKLRFYCYFDGKDYQVMEGGMAIYEETAADGAGQQRHCKDIWVFSDKENSSTHHPSLLSSRSPIKRSAGLLSSRAADNLFWLGRYAERSEAATRIVLEIVLNITDEEQRMDLSSVTTLLEVLEAGCFLPQGICKKEGITKDRDQLFTLLSQVFFSESKQTVSSANSLPSTLQHLSRLTSLSRARLSTEMARIVRRVERSVNSTPAADFTEFRKVLQNAILHYSAFNGTTLSNLTRTRSWHFIALGKGIENMNWLVRLTNRALKHYPEIPTSLLDSILSVNDTTLTYRFRYQSVPQLAYVLDLILFDPANPRSLLTQLQNIESSLHVLLSEKESFNSPILLSVKRAMHFLETEFISVEEDQAYESSIQKVKEFIHDFKTEIPMISEKLGWEFFTHIDYQSS